MTVLGGEKRLLGRREDAPGAGTREGARMKDRMTRAQAAATKAERARAAWAEYEKVRGAAEAEDEKVRDEK